MNVRRILYNFQNVNKERQTFNLVHHIFMCNDWSGLAPKIAFSLRIYVGIQYLQVR